jgi:hypothetical protein
LLWLLSVAPPCPLEPEVPDPVEPEFPEPDPVEPELSVLPDPLDPVPAPVLEPPAPGVPLDPVPPELLPAPPAPLSVPELPEPVPAAPVPPVPVAPVPGFTLCESIPMLSPCIVVLSVEFIPGEVLAESIEPPVPVSLPELSPHAINATAAANTNDSRFIKFFFRLRIQSLRMPREERLILFHLRNYSCIFSID